MLFPDNIVTVEIYEKYTKEEMTRVNSLNSSKNIMWIMNERQLKDDWENNDVSIMPDAGGGNGKTLVDTGVLHVK